MTRGEFALFQALVLSEAGIWLADAKQALLVTRLTRRVRELGLPSFRSYHEFVEAHRDAELPRMLDLVCTNETHFFREAQHWDLLESAVFPRWEAEAAAGLRPHHIRAWCAACSTGEEPFSLAMVLHRRFAAQGWSVDVLASDLSTRVLAAAMEATWPVQRASEIPPPLLRRYMLRGTGSQEGRMRATRQLRALVRFERVNLSRAPLPVQGPFDLLLCRNVLIYFRPDDKLAVIRRLLPHLAPAGLLLLGHAESLQATDLDIVTVAPTVYQRPSHAARAATGREADPQ
ncbi:MAG: protein-glutamate O-methyltransferase CheR [Deltaproteobacteria bacterium]|nr:protein-glutamate O-methyltransferase CheR [Deltaproteobacteria bacterium]